MFAQPLRKPAFVFLALLAIIVAADLAALHVQQSQAQVDSFVLYAVLLDFMIVIPALFWLLVLRRSGRSIAKLAPLPLLGALAAWLVLPSEARSLVWRVAWPIELLIIAAEVAIVGYELRLLYRFVRKYRGIARLEPNRGEALRTAVRESFGVGKLASLALHDMSMAYYLLFSWRKKRAGNAAERSYTYHRTTGQLLIAAVVTKIIVFEGVAVHLIVQMWSHWLAWILTAADLWLIALLWADARASALQPVRIGDDGTIRIRYGLRIQADVPSGLIAEAAAAREFALDPQERNEAALPLLSAPNVRLRLAEPVRVETVLFQPRLVRTIYLTLDEPEAFVRHVRKLQAPE